jgi:hypothetical protein
MFDTLCDLVPRDNAYPGRVRKLTILNRVLDGTIYDILPYHFHEERSEAGEYIPLRQRRPSVRYPLCRIVVEDSVSLLFSEGHFPTIDSPDPSLLTLPRRVPLRVVWLTARTGRCRAPKRGLSWRY